MIWLKKWIFLLNFTRMADLLIWVLIICLIFPLLWIFFAQSNSGLGGRGSICDAPRNRSAPMRVVCMTPSSSRTGDRNSGVVMETPLKELKKDSPAPDADGSSGGPQDVYGEDRATEDHFVTPWSVSVAR